VAASAVFRSGGEFRGILPGLYERGWPCEPTHLQFRYQVIRLWQLPPERLLAGGLEMLALTPISALKEAELPAVIDRMMAQLGRERKPAQGAKLWTGTYVLRGLRYECALSQRLLRG